MLKSLYIRNIILIDEMDIEFKDGLCVLTGETGAGKSIILDSLGLVLGNRADLSMKPKNDNDAKISAIFTNYNTYIDDILETKAIEKNEELILKRIISKDGKSKSFVNDQIVSLNTLRKIGENLIEIESQFSEQGLLNSSTHLHVLDEFGSYNELLRQVQIKWDYLKIIENEYEDLKKKSETKKKEQEDINYNIKELKKLDPQNNDYSKLKEKRELLSNSEKIKDSITKILQNFNNENNLDIESLVNTTLKETEKISAFLPDISSKISEVFDCFLINLNEFKHELSNILDAENNKIGIEEIDEKIFQFNKLSKRLDCRQDELVNKMNFFQNLVDDFQNIEDALRKKKEKKNAVEKEYKDSATILSNQRVQAAIKMDKLINQELPDLKLENGFFKTMINKEDVFGILGIDNAKFLIKTNPNSQMDELKKISSGGELCRFALAIKVVSSLKKIKTIIFDEVDSGIGGSVASAVGERLKRLGEKKQVIVVTHSPQVAALGDQHLKVSKLFIDGNNFTRLVSLNQNDKITEIARMLSGKIITPEAELAARKLIDSK